MDENSLSNAVNGAKNGSVCQEKGEQKDALDDKKVVYLT
jgi:hypothetical protein